MRSLADRRRLGSLVWCAATLLVLVSCSGTELEGFGSPRAVRVATWKGWCAVRAELVRTFNAFFTRETITHGEFISASSRLQQATGDWAEEARSDGAKDVASLLSAVAEAVGHTKVAVDTRDDAAKPRREFANALGALPSCAGHGESNEVLPPPSVSPTPKPSTPRASPTFSGVAPDCRAVDLNVTLASERSSYEQGQTVRLKLTARNGGGSTCAVRTGRCLDVVDIEDAAGTRVWTSSPTSSCPEGSSQVLVPNEGIALTFSWDQICTPSDCSGQVPAGGYTARGDWTARAGRKAHSTTASFTIKPSSTETPTSSPNPFP